MSSEQKLQFWDRSQMITQGVLLASLFLFITLAVYKTDENMKLEATLKACQAKLKE